MTKTLPITQARDELTKLVHNARKNLSEYTITVNGSPAAVIISAQEYESWKETFEILSHTSLVESIRKGEKDVVDGNVIDLETLKEELKLTSA